MPKHFSAALPIAYVVLRILIVLNWLFGAAILALLAWSLTNDQWMLTALKIPDTPAGWKLIWGMRAVAALGLVAILLNYAILKRLLAMVVTVRVGDPFVAANAYRLHAIAWALLALQLLGLAIAAIARAVSTPANPFDVDAGFSINGWLAVILTFVLARVFAQGALMREDLEGTI